MIKVTVYNEYVHELEDESIAAVYPKGIHGCIADFLGKDENIEVKTVTLSTVNELTEEALRDTDVLIWWKSTAQISPTRRVLQTLRSSGDIGTRNKSSWVRTSFQGAFQVAQW